MASGSGIVWQSSPGDMSRKVENYKQKLLQAVFRLATEWAAKIAADAKTAAPWKDQTGDARRGLFGRVFRLAMGAVIVVGYSVEYGIYLERRWGGRYATVWPAIQRAQAAVMAALQGLVR